MISSRIKINVGVDGNRMFETKPNNELAKQWVYIHLPASESHQDTSQTLAARGTDHIRVAAPRTQNSNVP